MQWGSDHVEVVEDRVHPWFVQDGTAHHRGWRVNIQSAKFPPLLVPKTASGPTANESTRAAASSACSTADVVVHPAGAGLRPFPRRS